MEWMESGSLAEILVENEFIKFPEHTIAFVCKHVLYALNFVHSKRRIHRDIKSDNILLDQHGNIKIGDFGFAAQMTPNQDKRTTVCGVCFIPLFFLPSFLLSFSSCG